MPFQLPTLEEECVTALLQYSNHTKAALQQLLPGRLRAQLTRRIIIEGKVTAMATALYTWAEKSLVVGDLCCREPTLFEHGRRVAVDDLLPQMLQHSLGSVKPPPPLSEPPRAPLPIAFLCARFLELVMSGHSVPLQHLDLTFYGLLDLPDLVPVLQALRHMHCADAARDLEFLNPHTLSVSIAFSTATHPRDELDESTETLAHLLEQQSGRRVRCLLRITGLKSAGGEQQKRTRRLLRMLAQHSCPLELLVARGPAEWIKSDHTALVKRFTHLRLLGSGACDGLVRARGRGPASGEPVDVPRQYNVRSLSLTGCTPGPARRLKTACLPSGWLRSLSVSASLLSLFAVEELRQLRRLSIVHGHGPAEGRPQHMDGFLMGLPELRALQLLYVDDLLGESQVLLLAAALPELEALRFARFPTRLDEPLKALVEVCIGARRAPILTALHVKLECQVFPPGEGFLQLAERLRRKIGPPWRDNVCVYLTEMAGQEQNALDQLQLLPV